MFDRRIFFAFLAWLTLASAGYAAAPTISNNGNCTSALAASTIACSVTTTGTNKIVVITTTTQNSSATARSVTSVTDNGSAGLSFVKAPAASVSASTTCLAGAINPCALDVEQWWALATSALTTESLTVNLSGSATVVIAGWIAVGGVFDTAAPFDSNSTLAAVNNGGSATIPTMSTYSTSSSDDLLTVAVVVGRNQGPWTPCFLTFSSWANTINIQFTAQVELSVATIGVTALQSAITAPQATSSGDCPTPGTVTGSGDGWILLATAMNGNAPLVLSSPVFGWP